MKMIGSCASEWAGGCMNPEVDMRASLPAHQRSGRLPKTPQLPYSGCFNSGRSGDTIDLYVYVKSKTIKE